MSKEPTWDRPPPPPKSAVSPAACCAGAGCTTGSESPSAIRPSSGASTATGCESIFDPDAVERMVFEVYDAEQQKSRRIGYVDAADYDQLHVLYAESEAARVRQMRTIDDLTRERDALAAECKAIRRCVNADEIYGWADLRVVGEAGGGK